MAEQKITQNLLANLVEDIKNSHAPDAATLREDKVLKINSDKPFDGSPVEENYYHGSNYF